MSRPSNTLLLIRSAMLAALMTGPAVAQQDSARDAVERGNAHYQAGEFEAAKLDYDLAAQEMPESPVVHFNLGDVAFKLENDVQAQHSYIAALKSEDPHLISRAHYNLGNVMYQRALYGMRSFRDVIGPLRTAMSHYREALDLDPDFEDARYNLELAHRLVRSRQDQTTQPTPNPRDRKQQTVDSKGLSEDDDRAQKGSPSGREARSGKTEALLERLHKLAQITDAPADTGSRSRPSQQPEMPMSVEDANQLLDVSRERARVNRERRKQARYARLRDADVDKIW